MRVASAMVRATGPGRAEQRRGRVRLAMCGSGGGGGSGWSVHFPWRCWVTSVVGPVIGGCFVCLFSVSLGSFVRWQHWHDDLVILHLAPCKSGFFGRRHGVRAADGGDGVQDVRGRTTVIGSDGMPGSALVRSLTPCCWGCIRRCGEQELLRGRLVVPCPCPRDGLARGGPWPWAFSGGACDGREASMGGGGGGARRGISDGSARWRVACRAVSRRVASARRL